MPPTLRIILIFACLSLIILLVPFPTPYQHSESNSNATLPPTYYDALFVPLITRINPHFRIYQGFGVGAPPRNENRIINPIRSLQNLLTPQTSSQAPKLHSRVHFQWPEPSSTPPLLFMHITDIHIGHQRTNQANGIYYRKLLAFQDAWRDRIGELVITGDLTHGETVDVPVRRRETHGLLQHAMNVLDRRVVRVFRGSQSETQWKQYWEWRDRWEKSGVRVMDLKGNHDAFNVVQYDTTTVHPAIGKLSEVSMEKIKVDYLYGLGEKHGESAHDATSTAHDAASTPKARSSPDLAIVSLSAHPRPFGAFAPYNFWGTLNSQDMTLLENTLRQIREASPYTTIIMACHYPQPIITAARSSTGRNMHTLMRRYRISAFLSGHLHTLFGLTPQLYARLPKGHMELQMSDSKVANRFRLLALDNGVLSWVDSDMFSDAPVVLVTNPKPCKYLIETEPFHLMKERITVRLYAIPRRRDASITSVRVSIDDKLVYDGHGASLARIKSATDLVSNFYEVPYNPAAYTKGKHLLQITVTDSLSNTQMFSEHFSLDGTYEEFSWLQRIALLTDWHLVNQWAYFGGLVFAVAFVWLSGVEERLFLTFVAASLAFAPYFVGEMALDRFASVSSWGITHWDTTKGALVNTPTTDVYQLLLNRYLVFWFAPCVLAFFLRQKWMSIVYTFLTCCVLWLIFWRRVVRFYGIVVLFSGWNGFWMPCVCLVVFWVNDFRLGAQEKEKTQKPKRD